MGQNDHRHLKQVNKDSLGAFKDIFKPACVTRPGCDPNKGVRAGEAPNLAPV